ncbi:hypothetical protein [Burkholderia ambifaria]|uniref:hypothetical protein n=1 Tax=Burkholderia ambifaria TaxID=152480 RepID=UPI000F8099C9|nr:hypothetical protein [Burkholderia ambifaria]
MDKTFLTVVVAEYSVREVVDHLRDLDKDCKVVAGGAICVAETDLSTRPNEVWLYDFHGNGELALVQDGNTTTHGRVLQADELQALTEYGVCVELKAAYARAPERGTPPPEAIYTSMVEATKYGFKVADEANFEASFHDTGDGTAVLHWMRVRVPAWMNFVATL